MRKQNSLIHLAEWCKQYGEDNGLRLFPATAPLDIVVDELIGRIDALRQYNENLLGIYNSMNERLTQLEQPTTKEVVKKVKK